MKKQKKYKLPIRRVTKKEMSKEDHPLHYYDVKTIAKRFKGKKERAAIAAIWRWLSLHGMCGWRTKDTSIYDTAAMGPGRKKKRLFDLPDAIVVTQDDWEHAEKVLKLGDQ